MATIRYFGQVHEILQRLSLLQPILLSSPREGPYARLFSCSTLGLQQRLDFVSDNPN